MNQPAYQPPRPFHEALTGWMPNPDSLEDWANTVALDVVTRWTVGENGSPAAEDGQYYADHADERQLVQVDTNYKDTRTSDYPVLLARTDAVQLAAHLLTAVEDTFHFSRVGQLRAVEAAALLRVLPDVELALVNLRSHALDDLLNDTHSDPDEQPEPDDG